MIAPSDRHGSRGQSDWVSLLPHPATPCPLVHRLDAAVARRGAALLELRFVVDGQIDRLRVAPPRRQRRHDGLWRHTCFEAFVAAPGASAYCELNFAPSSAWAAYAFDAYRQGMREATLAAAPAISVVRGPDRLSLDARVVLPALAGSGAQSALRVGLAAVLEDASGALTYWALKHPADEPDFHHAASFALALPPAAGRGRVGAESGR
jgi:hypothetical protein